MSSRLRMGIIIAVVGLALIALGIFAMVRLYQQTNEVSTEEVVSEVVEVDVIVASHDLALGTFLSEEDLTITQIPIAFTTRDTLDDLNYVIGKILKVDLVKGEMILDHNLASPTNSIYDIAWVLSEDHVLMAFPANDLISRESIIQRGDIVDLFVTMTTELTEVDNFGNEITESVSMTFDAMQRISITAMVVDIIQTEDDSPLLSSEEASAPPPPTRQNTNVKAYLLSLDPQDALVLKHLKDLSAVFDFVIRAPTSTLQFDLTPITNEYLNELYGLEILP